MSKAVIQHVLARLHDIGIKDISGVAGDYAFPLTMQSAPTNAFDGLGIATNLMLPIPLMASNHDA